MTVRQMLMLSTVVALAIVPLRSSAVAAEETTQYLPARSLDEVLDKGELKEEDVGIVLVVRFSETAGGPVTIEPLAPVDRPGLQVDLDWTDQEIEQAYPDGIRLKSLLTPQIIHYDGSDCVCTHAGTRVNVCQ